MAGLGKPIIRTVTGDIEPAKAGRCYAHEHIIIDPAFITFCNPDFLLDSVERACVDVVEFREAGGGTLVDSMPCGGGRNVIKLADVSRRTGAFIVCPTGVHLERYYAPGHWSQHLNNAELAKLFIADLEEGIDARDYNGPSIIRTKHRAGIIKIATSGKSPTSHERKIFEAAALAHKKTGAPILTHTEQGEGALEQVQMFEEFDASLQHIVLSHTDRRPDIGYHREILSTGVAVEYDSAFRWPGQDNPTLRLVCEMFAAGFGSQILLGMDAARRKYWHAYDGQPGLAFLLKEFVPRLKREGLRDQDIDSIFLANPQRCYSFLPL